MKAEGLDHLDGKQERTRRRADTPAPESGETSSHASPHAPSPDGFRVRVDRHNYRKHSDKNKRLIKRSLKENGAGRSIVVDNTGESIGGSGVLEQAEALGLKKRIVETDGSELVVDFYGGNCKIGGGSPWTKDGTKADLSLNLLARANALSYIEHHSDCPEVYCSISCRIGSPLILVAFTDRQGNELLSYRDKVTPEELIREFHLREPRFAEFCRNGLFS